MLSSKRPPSFAGEEIPPGITFFDLDHTLITANGSVLFGVYLYRQGKSSLLNSALILLVYLLKTMKIVSLLTLHRWSFRYLFKGKNKGEYLPLVRQQIAKDLPKYKSSLMEPALQQALARGDVYLVSSSPDFIVQEYAAAFGFHGFQGTEYATDHQGNFSHVEGLVDGAAKRDFARERARGLVSYAYSDDLTDAPLLGGVDFGYLVAKDSISPFMRPL